MRNTARAFLCVISLALFVAAVPALAADTEPTDAEKIDQAWGEVTAEYQAFLSRTLAVVADGDPVERYDAYTNAMAMFVDMHAAAIYRSSGRDQPEFLPFGTPISNSCSNNMGTRYLDVFLEPGASYRVWGTKGNALEIDLQQFNSFAGVAQGYPIAASGDSAQRTFTQQNIKLDSKGRFEFILSPVKPDKGQWWRLTDGARMIQFRDFWADYSQEAVVPVYHIEKLGPREVGPTAVSVEEGIGRLHALALALKTWDICFRPITGGSAVVPLNGFVQKKFYANPDDKSAGSGQQVNQTYYLSEFNLPPGQAMVVEWKPPARYLFWNIELNTRVGQYFNFGARQVDLTGKMAHIDKDGMIRLVISHEIPHVANWLDLDGHNRGLIWLRCKMCTENTTPSAKVMSVDQVLASLPQDTTMVSDKERQRQLDLRRRHFLSRYRL